MPTTVFGRPTSPTVDAQPPADEHTFPVTAAQQHLITAALLRPDVSHVVAMYVDIVGDLDVSRLQRAVAATGREMVVRRLRVGFVEDALVQWIAQDDEESADGASALPVIDLRASEDPVAAGTAWMHSATAEAADPLDDPAASDTLLRVGADRWFWYSRFQAHTFDAAGMRTLIERTADLYRADGSFRAPQPPAVARTLVESDRRYRQSERYEVDKRYWLDVLAGNPDPTSLSAVREPARTQPLVIERPLVSETRARLDVLARDSGSTAAGILTAAIAAFLAMRSGRERVVVTLPVTGRTAVAARRAPGTVANVLPVAIDVSPTTRVSDLMETVRARITEALRHQQFRLEDLEDVASDTGMRRTRCPSPGPAINLMLFPSTVSFGSVTGAIRVLSEGPVEDLAIDAWTTGSAEIVVGFRANPARYDQTDLEALHTAFLGFVDRFVTAEPVMAVGAIPGVDTADWETGIRSQRAVPFWTQQYLATAPALDLPVDTLEGPPTVFDVPAQLVTGLARRAAEFETGTSVLVMAALLGVLRRFGITGPVPVGLPVDGFVHGAADEDEPQVVVFRPNTPRDTSLADLVTACDRQVRNVFEYAGTRPTGAIDTGAPTYRVLLTADHAVAAHPDFPGLDIAVTSATADLVVTLRAAAPDAPDAGESGTVSWVGGARPAAALATAIPAMLRAIVDEPTTLISQVPVLDPAQRADLTDAPVAPRPVAGLIDLFHRVVALTPEAPAVSGPDDALDYRTLFRRANRMARFLIRHGVGPESVVAVLLPSGARRIVTTVAVCEAGGAYLPLEPGAGTAELVELINRVRPVCIATTRRWARHLEDVPFRVIDLDDWEVTRRIEVQSEDAILPEERYGEIRAENTAVVLPGPPVAGRRMATPMSHGAVVRLLAASADTCEFRSADVWTVVRPPSMIPTAWDIWGALVHGSRIAVPAASIADDPAAIQEFLTRQNTTVLCTAPPVLERIGLAEPDSLRLVVVSGQVDDPRRIPLPLNGSHTPDRVRILHRAGPVELARHAFRREAGAGNGAGYCPVPGTTAYILDERLEPVPVGAPGRLYVAGDRLPRNYLRAPRATATRLVANPFAAAESDDAGGRRDNRMLRTEARARWVAPGLLEILPAEDRRRAMIASWLRPDSVPIGGMVSLGEDSGIDVDLIDGALEAAPHGVSDASRDVGFDGAAAVDVPAGSMTPAGAGESAEPAMFSPVVLRTERTIATALVGLPGLGTPDREVDLVAVAPDSFTLVIAAQRISGALACRLRPSDILDHPTPGTLAEYLVRTGIVDSTTSGDESIDGGVRPTRSEVSVGETERSVGGSEDVGQVPDESDDAEADTTEVRDAAAVAAEDAETLEASDSAAVAPEDSAVDLAAAEGSSEAQAVEAVAVEVVVVGAAVVEVAEVDSDSVEPMDGEGALPSVAAMASGESDSTTEAPPVPELSDAELSDAELSDVEASDVEASDTEPVEGEDRAAVGIAAVVGIGTVGAADAALSADGIEELASAGDIPEAQETSDGDAAVLFSEGAAEPAVAESTGHRSAGADSTLTDSALSIPEDDPDDAALELSTERALAALAESAAIDAESPLEVSTQPATVLVHPGDGVTTPLVIVGSPDDFADLLTFLTDAVPVIAVPDVAAAPHTDITDTAAPAGAAVAVARYVEALREDYPTGAFRLLGTGAAGAAALGVAAALAEINRTVTDIVLIDPDPIEDAGAAPTIDGSLIYITILGGGPFDPERSASMWRPVVLGPIIDHRIDLEPVADDRGSRDATATNARGAGAAESDGARPVSEVMPASAALPVSAALPESSAPDRSAALPESAWRAIAHIIGKTDPAR
ncbi:AMP-binding protein [Millisia brevis]|uniref:AMP-binding protein n=1 Tax=Millisia brevis TaxID=264148 RepID=UPI00083699D6|nr:AMP-binding protein [Millisia brevis]